MVTTNIMITYDDNIYNDFGRSQKAKVGSAFSDLLDILYGVPQGS